MNINDHDQMQMRSYIERGVKDDTLHTLSYFRSYYNSIKEVTKKILEDGGYEFDEVEMTNMWGNLLKLVCLIHLIHILIIRYLVFII